MIADKLNEKTALVAFPLETVLSSGRFVGFTIRKAVGSKLLLSLCISSDRKAEFGVGHFVDCRFGEILESPNFQAPDVAVHLSRGSHHLIGDGGPLQTWLATVLYVSL